MIPIARPDLGSEEIAAVTEVLTSGMIAQGRKVAELEASGPTSSAFATRSRWVTGPSP